MVTSCLELLRKERMLVLVAFKGNMTLDVTSVIQAENTVLEVISGEMK
jgi:hypothetical protein